MSIRANIAADTEIATQLAALRDFTSVYGVLHEAQVLQLKIWPRLMFPNATRSSCVVNCEDSSISIEVKLKGKTARGQAPRTEALARTVQWMLGPQWRVKVLAGKKKLYDLAAKKVSAAGKYAGTDFAAGMIVPEQPWKFKQT